MSEAFKLLNIQVVHLKLAGSFCECSLYLELGVENSAVVCTQVFQSCLVKGVKTTFYGNIHNASMLLAELQSKPNRCIGLLKVREAAASWYSDQALLDVAYPHAGERETALQLDTAGPTIPVSGRDLLGTDCRKGRPQ